VPLELGHDAFPTRGVADERVSGRAAVDEDVVDHPAIVVGQEAVLDLVGRQAGDVVGRDPLQPVERARPLERQPAHVADVEEADPVRTARCSSTIVVYWMGIDQPANSTSRPPFCPCHA
jgi:hypothetical protein